jgi:integration host factor subunit beta
MTKAELVQKILNDNLELKRADAEALVDAIFGTIASALARGDRVELRGLGTFSTRHRNARIRHNPRTGAPVSVPPKRVPFFKPSRQLHTRLNANVREVNRTNGRNPG